MHLDSKATPETPTPRSVWNGAISFGLIHVPVSMFPPTQDSGVDFDWLDRRSLDPVGYARISKRTNKSIDRDDVIKGVKTPDGTYAIIEEDEIKAAYPKAAQSIETETFVKASEVPSAGKSCWSVRHRTEVPRDRWYLRRAEPEDSAWLISPAYIR